MRRLSPGTRNAMKNSKVIFQFVKTCHSSLTNPIREQCVSRPFVVADVYADTNSKFIVSPGASHLGRGGVA